MIVDKKLLRSPHHLRWLAWVLWWEVDMAAGGRHIHLPPHDLRTAEGSEEAEKDLSSCVVAP